jgi:fluoride exporter
MSYRGVLAGLVTKHEMFSADARLLLFTGVLGGFTTFSAFGVETMYLLKRGELAIAAVLLSVAAALIALWIGFGMIRE